jgi:WD40 repeat protein
MVGLWDPATGALYQALKGHPEFVRSVAFSPDSRLLASSSQDTTVRLWSPATGALHQALDGHSDWVLSVAFSPDGRLLASGSYDNTVRLWDPATGALHQVWSLRGRIDALTFSSDGLYIKTNVGSLDLESWYDNHTSGPPHVNLESFIEPRNWITLNGEKSLWLPAESRPMCSASIGSMLALGHVSGRVSFIEFRV